MYQVLGGRLIDRVDEKGKYNFPFFSKILFHQDFDYRPLNPFAPGDFAEKRRVVFWSLSCYKELKLTTNRFTGRTLGGLLIQMQNISLRSSGMRRKQNFDILGLKVTQQS